MSKLAKVYKLDGCDSVEAMLEKSHTNWDIETHDVLQGNPPEGFGFTGGGFKALVRPDTRTALSFVSERFRPNSHRKQLAPLDTFMRSGDLVPVTASVWDNGSIIAYQIRCPQLDVTIHGQDVVSPLLTLVFGYGFKIADSAFFADFRWFCKNQMGQVSKLMTERIRHKGNIMGNYADLVGKRLTELSGELAGHYQTMRQMADRELTGRRLHNYLAASVGLTSEQADLAYVMPQDELRGDMGKIPTILDCYREDDCGAAGTVWHAYNAVTRHETHKTGRNEASRQRRMLLGAGANVAHTAFEEAAKLVQVAS